ncbi:hypothetical protein [Spirosoma arcticum]
MLTVAGLMADDFRDTAGVQAGTFLAVFGFSNAFLLAVGPCLYFSVLSFTQVRYRFRLRHGLHFLPWLANGLVLLICGWTIDVDNLITITPQTARLFWLLESFSYVALVQNVVYLVVMLRRLADHNRNIRLFSSATDLIDLRWLQRFIVGVSVMLLV